MDSNDTHDGRARVARLSKLEKMMTEAYDVTLGKESNPDLAEILRAFRAHHQRNASRLMKAADEAGGEAPEYDHSFLRYVDEVMRAINSAVARDEALGELRIAEAALEMTYGISLAEETDERLVRAFKECMRNEAEHVPALAMAHEASRS